MLLNTKEIEMLKKKYPAGTRIKLNYMVDDYGVESGTCGTVDFVDDAGQIQIIWDNGRSLALIDGVDNFDVIENQLNIKI